MPEDTVVQRGEVTIKSKPNEQAYKFPTEIIELPSKGFFYPEGNPLATGELELKYMTAKEEDILTSQTLIRKGVVLDKLLEAVIMDKNVDVDDLLLGDKNAIYIATRIMAYGPEYNVNVTCPACGQKQAEKIDLSKLSTKEVDFESLTRNQNRFSFILPNGITLEWKILSERDDKAIEEELEARKKFDKGDVTAEITTRFRHIIVSVDGDETVNRRKKFVENELLSRDIRLLRTEMDRYIPDVELSYNFVCSACGVKEEMRVPIGAEFFWPSI